MSTKRWAPVIIILFWGLMVGFPGSAFAQGPDTDKPISVDGWEIWFQSTHQPESLSTTFGTSRPIAGKSFLVLSLRFENTEENRETSISTDTFEIAVVFDNGKTVSAKGFGVGTASAINVKYCLVPECTTTTTSLQGTDLSLRYVFLVDNEDVDRDFELEIYLAEDAPTLVPQVDLSALTLSDLPPITLQNAKNVSPIITLRGHTAEVLSVAFDPSGKTLASGSRDGTVRIWDLASGKDLVILDGHGGTVQSVAFSPSESVLASLGNGTLRLWDTNTYSEIAVYESCCYNLIFSPDGKMLATTTGKVVNVLDAQTGILLHTLEGHDQEVKSIEFGLNSATIASGSSDKTIRLWDLDSGTTTSVLKGHEGWVLSMSFSPDGTMLASGDKTVHLWDLATGQELASMHDGISLKSMEFSPDGGLLVSTGTVGVVRLWDITGQTKLLRLEGHNQDVNAAAFSPKGNIIASASDDKTVKIWGVVSD